MLGTPKWRLAPSRMPNHRREYQTQQREASTSPSREDRNVATPRASTILNGCPREASEAATLVQRILTREIGGGDQWGWPSRSGLMGRTDGEAWPRHSTGLTLSEQITFPSPYVIGAANMPVNVRPSFYLISYASRGLYFQSD